MKVKILFLFIALTMFSGTGEVFGQKKKDPRLLSGKNLRNTLLTMMRQAKAGPAKKYECDIVGLLKSLPRKDMVPSAEELKKEIGHIMDSLDHTKWSGATYEGPILEKFLPTKNRQEFLRAISKDIAEKAEVRKKDFDKFYYGMREAQKSGFKLKDKSIKKGECAVKVETALKPTKFVWDTEKNYNVTNATWEITMIISVDCPCTKKNKFKVRKATYRYTATVEGPIMFNVPARFTLGNQEVVKYGLRFGKVKDPKLAYIFMECCKGLKDPVEDGSFVDPDEDINDKNTLLDVGTGIGFGSEVETNIGFSGGVLFNIAEIGGNPLFLGPKASVNTTSITSDEIKELKVLIGPTAEYQIPLNSGSVNIITGVNSGYVFGNLDAFGFERDISGFAVNTYAGAQITVGSNVALTAVLNFFEFNNLTFKSDMENFESTTSNTTFLTDGGAINVGVRIGLD